LYLIFVIRISISMSLPAKRLHDPDNRR